MTDPLPTRPGATPSARGLGALVLGCAGGALVDLAGGSTGVAALAAAAVAVPVTAVLAWWALGTSRKIAIVGAGAIAILPWSLLASAARAGLEDGASPGELALVVSTQTAILCALWYAAAAFFRRPAPRPIATAVGCVPFALVVGAAARDRIEAARAHARTAASALESGGGATAEAPRVAWLGTEPVLGLSSLLGETCALVANGDVHCWDDQGETALVPASKTATAGAPVRAVALAFRLLCVGGSGSPGVVCLPRPDESNRGAFGEPWTVAGPADVNALALGDPDGYAVSSSGALWRWSTRGGGDASEVAGVLAKGVAAEGQTACALDASGAAMCWPPRPGSRSPVRVELPGQVASVAVGGGALWSVLHDGSLWWWRMDDAGAARRVRTEDKLVEVAATAHWGCARTESGSVDCWRTRSDGAPPDLGAIPRVQAATHLAVDPHGACASTQGDGVMCWPSPSQ